MGSNPTYVTMTVALHAELLQLRLLARGMLHLHGVPQQMLLSPGRSRRTSEFLGKPIDMSAPPSLLRRSACRQMSYFCRRATQDRHTRRLSEADSELPRCEGPALARTAFLCLWFHGPGEAWGEGVAAVWHGSHTHGGEVCSMG